MIKNELLLNIFFHHQRIRYCGNKSKSKIDLGKKFVCQLSHQFRQLSPGSNINLKYLIYKLKLIIAFKENTYLWIKLLDISFEVVILDQGERQNSSTHRKWYHLICFVLIFFGPDSIFSLRELFNKSWQTKHLINNYLHSSS